MEVAWLQLLMRCGLLLYLAPLINCAEFSHSLLDYWSRPTWYWKEGSQVSVQMAKRIPPALFEKNRAWLELSAPFWWRYCWISPDSEHFDANSLCLMRPGLSYRDKFSAMLFVQSLFWHHDASPLWHLSLLTGYQSTWKIRLTLRADKQDRGFFCSVCLWQILQTFT